VITTNLHPISHRFEVIADYWSNLRFRQRGTPFDTLVRGARTLNSGPRNLAQRNYKHCSIVWCSHIYMWCIPPLKVQICPYKTLPLVLSQYSRYERISIGSRRCWRGWVTLAQYFRWTVEGDVPHQPFVHG